MSDRADFLPHREISPEDIPRCTKLDGSTLTILPAFAEDQPSAIAVTDGERTAIYVPLRRDEAVATGSDAHPRIIPAYTEGGWFTEANVIKVTDGERTAVYVPLRKVERAE